MDNTNLSLATTQQTTLITNITNKTTETTEPLCQLLGPSSHLFAAVLIFLSMVGTLENGLVLIAMITQKSLRTPSVFLIGKNHLAS